MIITQSAPGAAPDDQERRRAQAAIERRDAIMAPFEERLADLRRRAHRHHAALMRATDERRELLPQRRELQGFLNRDPDRATIKRDLERVEHDIARLDAEADTLRALWAPQAGLIAAVEEWLNDHTRALVAGTLVLDPLPAPPKRKVDDIRAQIAKFHEEYQQIETAWPTQPEAVESLAQVLEREAARAFDTLGSGALRRGQLPANLWRWDGRAALGLIAAVVGPDQMARRLVTLAMDVNPEPGIDGEYRAHKLAEIQSERVKLEREEEALIRQSETTGHPITRRPDADPATVMTP